MKLRDLDKIETIISKCDLHDCPMPVIHYYTFKKPEACSFEEAFSRMRLTPSNQTIVIMLETSDHNDPAELVVSCKGQSLAVNYQRGCDGTVVYDIEQLVGLVGLP